MSNLNGMGRMGQMGRTGMMGMMDWMGRWWYWGGRLLAPAGTGATEQERHHWLDGYCKQGVNGTDLLDWLLVGQGWDGITLAGAGTGAPPWAPEQERHHWLLRVRALYEVVVATNISGAAYLCRISKTIHIECTQIRTSNVVQDSIKRTYDTIILWLHITINHTYNVIVPK